MSCGSAVFVANNVSAAVAANASIPLGTIQRRYGCALNAASAGVTITQKGYYLVNATITFTAPAAGVVAISLQDNGQQVVGVTAAESVTTPTTEQHTIALTGIVRSLSGSDVLTLVNTGIAMTPSIVSLNVVKI